VPEAPEQFSRCVELIDAATAEIWLCPTKAAVMLPPDASLDRPARSVYAAVDDVEAVVGEDFRLRTVLTNCIRWTQPAPAAAGSSICRPPDRFRLARPKP
jgi:hypothetical protein